MVEATGIEKENCIVQLYQHYQIVSAGVLRQFLEFQCSWKQHICNIPTQTLLGPHMQGSDPHMEGSGPSKPYGFEGPVGLWIRVWVQPPSVWEPYGNQKKGIWGERDDSDISIPDTPCMAYLPTLGWFWGSM